MAANTSPPFDARQMVCRDCGVEYVAGHVCSMDDVRANVGRIVFGPSIQTSEMRRVAVQHPVEAAQALVTLKEEVKRLRAALRLCISAAGAPDPADGCRQVIRIATENLESPDFRTPGDDFGA